jgi:hypothetical protein
MNIIRTFDVSTPVTKSHIWQWGNRWKVVQGEAFGDILFPIIHPRLADKFFGFEVIGEGDIRVAVKSPTANMWFHFDGSGWCASQFPVFISIKSVRNGMPFWAGAIQFLLQLGANSSVQELKMGYSVCTDLIEYLLEIALPQKLNIPIHFSQTVAINSDGYSTPFPDGFDNQILTDVKLHLFDQVPVSAAPVPELGRIELPQDFPPNSIGQLLFSIYPRAEFSRYLHQITQVPCVIIREIDEGIHHRPIREDSIQVSDTEFVSTTMIYGADQNIEISCVAVKEGEARKIALALSDLINNNGELYSPPHDLSVGLQLIGSIKQGSQNYIKSGTLPTMTFKVAIRNVSY